MLMLIYYFMAFIAKQDLQTIASTCFFSILAYLSSVLFIMKPTQMKRDIYYVLLFHSA